MSPAPKLPTLFTEAPPEPAPVTSTPVKHWWERKNVRTWTIVGIVLAILVALQFVATSGPARPYDPDSTYPSGTKGFVELMERTGTKVVRDARPRGDVAVLMYDTLDQDETTYVEQWVEDGGTLIISDPYSSFQVGQFSDSVITVPTQLQPHCSTAYTKNVENISPSRKGKEMFYKSDLNADSQCFRAGKNSYYFEERVIGRGRVLELGGSEIFTNDRLGKADNAVFLMNLVQPEPTGYVTLLETRSTSTQSDSTDSGVSLFDLFSKRFKDGLLLLLVASVLYLMWRARRLGKPVEEEPLVRIPASQLVAATGDLLELADQPQAAAAMMRDDLRRSLADRFGLRADADVNALVELISQRTGIDPQRIRAALNDDSVTGPESLVVYAQQVERLQMEVKHVR
jgi:hypothetical protein